MQPEKRILSPPGLDHPKRAFVVRESDAKVKKRPSNKAFFKTPHNVIDSNRFRSLTFASQSLYNQLSRLGNWYCNGKPGTFRQTDSQLINETGMDERTIRRSRKELIERGFISTNKPAPRSPTTYTVLHPME